MYPDKTSGVTLKCHKLHQAVGRVPHSRTTLRLTKRQATSSERQTNIRAYDYLAAFCQLQPVHTIFGAVPDFL